jgi:hypothetical protein
MTTTTSARWAELDADFQLTDLLGGNPFEIIRRDADSPWTVTAPHAVARLDGGGAAWPADRATGGLALLLNELGVARALVTSGRWDADADAVPTHLCPFKSILLDQACPTLVLDLHEAGDGHGLHIDVGIRPELVRRPLDGLMTVAENFGYPVSVRASWSQPGTQRVLDALHGEGVPALRVGLPTSHLDPWTAPHSASRLVAMLRTFLAP